MFSFLEVAMLRGVPVLGCIHEQVGITVPGNDE